jgi:hypothetical protein
MKERKYFAAFLGSVILVVGITLGYSVVSPGPQERLTPHLPLKIGGFSAIWVWTEKDGGTSQNMLAGGLDLYYGSNPAENMWVKINKLNLKELAPGQYRGQENGTAVFPSRLIEVAIGAKPSTFIKPGSGVKEPKPLVTCQARLTNIVEIISPSRLETIDLATTSSLTVRWRRASGAGLISTLSVIEGTGGAKLFEQLNIPGDSFNISTSIFRPGRQYSIFLTWDNPDFVFTGYLASSSRLRLFFRTFVTFSTR